MQSTGTWPRLIRSSPRLVTDQVIKSEWGVLVDGKAPLCLSNKYRAPPLKLIGKILKNKPVFPSIRLRDFFFFASTFIFFDL